MTQVQSVSSRTSPERSIIWGDIDFYLFGFEPAAGDTVIVQVTGTGGSRDPCLSLFDPNDNQVGGNVCGFPFSIARGEFRGLTKTGTYTVRVFTRGYASRMTYTIFLQCIGECSSRIIDRHYLRVSQTSCDAPCQEGDNFTARVSLNNPLPDAVELKFGYVLSHGRRSNIGDPHRELPGETRWDDEEVEAGPLPPGPPGRWQFCGRLMELQLGQTLAVHCRPFDVISPP